MSINSDLRELFHGEPLTEEQREAHEEAGESFHFPAIVHRSGGISAERLNVCGICGAQIFPSEHGWIAITDDAANKLRGGA